MTAEGWRARMREVQPWAAGLVELDKPLIAAVDGAAYGAGFSLALTADFVLATPRSRFCMSFMRVGLVPDFAAMYTLPRIVGLPAGTRVPVRVEVSGDLFRPASDAILPLTLDQPLEILLRDGQPTGDVRAPGGPWRLARETHWISIPWIRASLDPTHGPQVESALVVDFQGGSPRQ